MPTVRRVSPRPRRPPPSKPTIDRLHRLLERARQADRDKRQAVEELYLAVLEASEKEGATREFLARELGVGVQTVQDWVDRARQHRQGG